MSDDDEQTFRCSSNESVVLATTEDIIDGGPSTLDTEISMEV